jgi:hypothetical protein
MRYLFQLFSPRDAAGADDAALDREAESLRQAAGDDDPDGSGEEPQSVADASRAFLAGLSEQDRDRPFTDLDDDNEDDNEDEARLQRRRESDGADADEEEEDEPITRQEDGAVWKKHGKTWRWVLEDGTVAEGEAPEGWEPPAAAAPPPKPRDQQPAARKAKVQKIQLAGEADRGEEDIELEVEDPEVAERLSRLQKQAMRRKDYERRREAIETRAAELDAIELEIDQDPVGFIIGKLPDGRRLEVARALLIQHLPELQQDVDALLDDEAERLRRQLALNKNMTQSQQRLEQAKAVRAHARKCMAAAQALIPEDVEQDVADEFLADARQIFAQAAQAGTRVTPENAKELLARRLKLYGFDQSRRAPRTRTGSGQGDRDQRRPAARPVSDRARDIADRRPAGASASNDRLRRVQLSRTAASRQAPAGAGAAPATVPVLKPEEETDVRTASKALRQKGLPQTWAAAQGR